MVSFDLPHGTSKYDVQVDNGTVRQASLDKNGVLGVQGWNKGKMIRFKIPKGAAIEEETMTIYYWKLKN